MTSSATASSLASLGGSQVMVTRLGFGSALLGGLFAPMDDESAAAVLAAVWDSGSRYIDTAPHYGVGLAEERVGTFLATRPREEYVLSTKVGRLLVPQRDPGRPGGGECVEGFYGTPARDRVRDYSSGGVLRALSDSLERLKLDRVDVLYIHDPDDYWQQAVEEAYPTLADLRSQGVVGAIGVGMNQAAMLARFVRETDLDCVLVAGRYTLLDQQAATELLPLCLQRGVAVVVGGVFNSGVLADPSPVRTYDYGPVPVDVLARALRLQEVCARHGTALAAAALQFPLRHPAVVSVLAGARTPEEASANAALLETRLPDALWAEIDAELDPDGSQS
jgi:D-threo-aldose 1-dehydrogenase